jgi:hypothetical protein
MGTVHLAPGNAKDAATLIVGAGRRQGLELPGLQRWSCR